MATIIDVYDYIIIQRKAEATMHMGRKLWYACIEFHIKLYINTRLFINLFLSKSDWSAQWV